MIKSVENLSDVIEHRSLSALFQPVIDMKDGRIIGYDGLVRGPSNSLLHAPGVLFSLARQSGDVAVELENLCCQTVIESFVKLQLDGLLFLKVNAEIFLAHKFKEIRIPGLIQQACLDPPNVVVELILNEPDYSHAPNFLPKIVSRWAGLGYQVAIRDYGEIFSRLESMRDSLPSYLKINRYLIRDIDRDPVKSKFVRVLAEAAGNCGLDLIAEGIETRGEFLLTREMGIAMGQGNLIARPNGKPNSTISRETISLLSIEVPEKTGCSISDALLEMAQPFSPESSNEEMLGYFERNPQVQVVAVVDERVPVGLIGRTAFINRFARPYQRELHGKKSCSLFMDPAPLIVDKNISIQELSHSVAGDQRHMLQGFIFTDNGYYLGVGTSQNLIHEITQLQIHAARYSNPLTGLPGNIPIEEHIDGLLARRIPFCVCHFDLDNFKPFNDAYGFSMGDEMIRLTAEIIREQCDSESDFLGHVGGDDFIGLFCSADWEARCRSMLEKFGREALSFFKPEDIENGGYFMENRRGENEFHPLCSLSIGAVPVESAGAFTTHREIARIAAESKKMAKKTPGNSLFVNQRRYPAA
ncbi:MAG: GGDEF domain-containing protein [Burkholderiales bacterium]|nr:GGDEF domain-containing protein [Burkholderiales bacterium]